MWAQFSSFVLLCMGLEVFELQTSHRTGKLMSSLIFALLDKLNVHAGGSYVLSHAPQMAVRTSQIPTHEPPSVFPGP